MTQLRTFGIKPNMHTVSVFFHRFKSKCRPLLVTVCALLSLVACQPQSPNPVIVEVAKAKQLNVGILFTPTSYYVDTDGTAGFEHDLAMAFADYLGVEINFVPSFHEAELLPKLASGQVDILVGGFAPTHHLQQQFRTAPPYFYINQKVVYKQGRERPTKLSEVDAPIVVAAQSSHLEQLQLRHKQDPSFDIQIMANTDPNELLEMLMDGDIEFTVVDSHTLALARRYYPDISVAFTLSKQQPLTWILPNNQDDSLYAALIDFFGEQHTNGELANLEARYFGHVEQFNYVDTRLFMKAVEEVLPKYRDWFKHYAGDLDWRLLAAQSYQESHWDPRAKSPTGVRGIMMLTQPTAKQLGVKSRLDAETNIEGGAKYLQQLLNRVPARISEFDRPWFALAAYNLGWGHVQDGRKLTKQLGGDPDKWVDVQKYLPLLRKKRYYKTTRYGFARGDEAVQYVANIRRYYDTLIWIDEKAEQQNKLETLFDQAQQSNEAEELKPAAPMPTSGDELETNDDSSSDEITEPPQ